MSNKRFLWINGEKIIVSEDVYYAYKRPAWNEHKRRMTRADRERSIEGFSDTSFDFPFKQSLVVDIITDKLLLDELLAALAELTDDERSLIDALYYNNKSERDVAAEIGISKSSVHKQKEKILTKLKKILKKW